MNGKSKRKFTPEFKLKVILEVLKEKDTLAVISKRYELHANQISDWKKQFLAGASVVFEPGDKVAKPQAQETDAALLYEQIGRLQMEITFFKKKLMP
jgi:transposase